MNEPGAWIGARSDKIMRRTLRKIAENDLSNFGHSCSALTDPPVVYDFVRNRTGA